MIDKTKVVILNDLPITTEVKQDKNKLYVITFKKGSCKVEVMNNIKTLEKVQVEINRYINFTYIFIPINEELCNTINNDYKEVRRIKSLTPSFIEDYKFHPQCLSACGDTLAGNAFINQYVPYNTYVDTFNCLSLADKERNRKLGKFVHEFPCYAKKVKSSRNNANVAGLILHEDGKSAWRCLMNITGNPTHGLIIRDYTDS